MTEYQVSHETIPDRTSAPTQGMRTSEMTPILVEHNEGIMSY